MIIVIAVSCRKHATHYCTKFLDKLGAEIKHIEISFSLYKGYREVCVKVLLIIDKSIFSIKASSITAGKSCSYSMKVVFIQVVFHNSTRGLSPLNPRSESLHDACFIILCGQNYHEFGYLLSDFLFMNSVIHNDSKFL